MHTWTDQEWKHQHRIYTLEGCAMTLEALIARSIDCRLGTAHITKLVEALELVRQCQDEIKGSFKE